MKKILSLTFILMSTSFVVFGQIPEEETVLKTLADFETAIIENNSEAATVLLHEDVVILEGSRTETKEEYLSHHFHSDGRFLSAMTLEVQSEHVTIEGSIAWVSSVTKMSGTYNDREIDRKSLELVVLKKTDNVWKIIALHWS